MTCDKCKYFKILYEPLRTPDVLWDMGRAKCDKHDLITDFANHGKFKRLDTCEDFEPQEGEWDMTNSQAKSELMQIYMSLSEGKKQALDMAFKAMEQADGEYISKEKAIIQLSWDLSEVELPRIKESLDKLPSVAIPSADMFSDLKAEISMYENSDQSIDEMIQGIKSIISIYKR